MTPREGSGNQAFGTGELNSRVDSLAKDRRIEGMTDTLIARQRCDGTTELSGQGFQRREGRWLPLCPKAVQNAPKDSLLSAFMDMRIVAVEVAQAGL